MEITITEFLRKSGEYLEKAEKETIVITSTKRGKTKRYILKLESKNV